MATGTQEGTKAGTVSASDGVKQGGKGSRAGTRPEYGLKPVKDFAPEAPSLRGKQDTYVTLLQPIVDNGDAGQWYEIATFKTPTGAHQSADALTEGERKLPSAPGSWEFKAVKVVNPEDPDGKRHSKLYAKFTPK